MSILYEKPTQRQRNKSIDKKDDASSAPCKDTLLETAPNESNDLKSTRPSAM